MIFVKNGAVPPSANKFNGCTGAHDDAVQTPVKENQLSPGLVSRRGLLHSALALATPAAAVIPRTVASVRSPNGRLTVQVWLGMDASPGLTLLFDGAVLVRCSGLGLHLEPGGPLSARLRVVGLAARPVHDRYTLACGKTREVAVLGHELAVDLQEAGSGRLLRLITRVYDDGAAFRYVVPWPANSVIVLRSEMTRFEFPCDYPCWGLDLGAFDTAHEGEFQLRRASEMPAERLFDLPLVYTTIQGDVTFAIAEADVQDYAGLYLARPADRLLSVEARLPARPDNSSTAVAWLQDTESRQSPWRVVMVGDHPGRLIESTLITTLSRPSIIADTTWIRPGKAAWDWWATVVPRGGSGPAMGNGSMMRLIDFAWASGLQYLLIDAGWYAFPDHTMPSPDIDVTQSIPDISLPVLVEYGRQRGIGLFVWVHWQHLNAQFETALAFYAHIGIKGVKVDFMNRDDQPMIDFYHRLLRSAADRRLLVDLHGATHPTGLSRTYPNLLTQEGVMGAEHNKFSSRVSSRHNVTLPFTRMLLGPMDYTPGGFRNVTPAQFHPRSVLPMVQSTRGQALAMYVVYESPFACVSDSPDTYDGAAGFDFLKAVPTTWNETRVLDGHIGAFIVIARRSGAAWFVGAMTDDHARLISIPLGFLGPGRYKATSYADGDTPTDLVIKRDMLVVCGDMVRLAVTANGGAALAIYPIT